MREGMKSPVAESALGAGATSLPPEPEEARPGGLGGARVALLEGRMGAELAQLVRRHGGVPVLAPAVREVPLDAAAAVQSMIERLEGGGIDVVLFLTGVGADALFTAAELTGRVRELSAGLSSATTVCRGHKPRAALRRRGIPISALVAEPYTTTEVIETLNRIGVRERGVAIVHYGERNVVIGDTLGQWGSRVLDVCLYQWALPEDTAPLERLIDEIIDGTIDALAITSQVQVRHLFAVTARQERTLKLMRALNSRVVVAAVGPSCADALRAAGVIPRVVPSNPKMGPMIVALAEHFAASPADRTRSSPARDVE